MTRFSSRQTASHQLPSAASPLPFPAEVVGLGFEIRPPPQTQQPGCQDENDPPTRSVRPACAKGSMTDSPLQSVFLRDIFGTALRIPFRAVATVRLQNQGREPEQTMRKRF